MLATALFAILNKILEIIGLVANVLYSLLPSSPFTIIENTEFSSLIAKINYFLPVYEFVAIMETWLVAIAIFYLYSLFARWIKAIQ
jgi:hypothetical protein